MQSNRGTLTLIGGAEDRAKADGVLGKLLEWTGARHIVVVPTASIYGYELGVEYMEAFRRYDVDTVETMDVKGPEDTNNPAYHQMAQTADLIFFTGGDQVKLSQLFRQTELLQIIKSRFFEQGLHLAGTSAGAMVMSDPLIYEGDGKCFQKGAVFFDAGFGVMPDITIDTHFMERSRMPRICSFMASGYSKRGIGVSEDTAAHITAEDKMEIFGDGIVVTVNGDQIRYSNFHDVHENELIDLDNVALSFLVQGSRFDLTTWRQIKPEKRQSALPVYPFSHG